MEVHLRLLRYIIFLSILILLTVSGIFYFGRANKTIEAWGVVQPVNSVEVSSQISGLIEEVFTKEGERVNKGEMLLLIDDEELRVELGREEKRIEQLRMELGQLERELDRFRRTDKRRQLQKMRAVVQEARLKLEHTEDELKIERELYEGHISTLNSLKLKELDYQVAEAAYRALQNEFSLLKSGLVQEEDRKSNSILCKKSEIEQRESLCGYLRKKIEATKIQAPFTGTVLTKNVEKLKGRWVSEGEPVVQIADLSKMEFLAYVPQKDEYRIKVGQKVDLFMEAFPHREYKVFEGRVVEISPKPSVISKGVFFETTVEIFEPWVELEEHSRVHLKPSLDGKAEIIVESDVRLFQLAFKGVLKS